MQKLKSISSSAAGRAGMLAGSALIADGVLQVFHSQRSAGTRVVGVAGNLNLAFLIIALVALGPCLISLAAHGRSRAAERAGVAAGAGAGLLAIGCLTSLLNQHDLAAFPAIAALANVLWLAGMATVGVALKRRGRVGSAIAVGLPITWIFAIPLATVGGGLVSGAYFLAIGYRLATGAIERGARVSAAPVQI